MIARQDQTTMLLVRRYADAMTECHETIGQAQKGVDITVRSDDHDAYVELGERQR